MCSRIMVTGSRDRWIMVECWWFGIYVSHVDLLGRDCYRWQAKTA